MNSFIVTFTRRDGSAGGPIGLETAAAALEQLRFLREQGLNPRVHDALTKREYSEKALSDLALAARGVAW